MLLVSGEAGLQSGARRVRRCLQQLPIRQGLPRHAAPARVALHLFCEAFCSLFLLSWLLYASENETRLTVADDATLIPIDLLGGNPDAVAELFQRL